MARVKFPKKSANVTRAISANSSGAVSAPTNLDEEIRSLAYRFSEERGFEPGHETEDWLNAEREVLERYHQQRV